ncbi:hypothetical protein [Bradyrhizobium sp. SZCCHNRI1073]|uniref:hypothetical protein n=1 Tax=Bradyrhizobium sp. SZCCHNRI1073 TaxID=3057280 RepID=UPI002915EC1D|nr:hypothetical protein [Bradyrhizobium sp. SZCCHNRI1073]
MSSHPDDSIVAEYRALMNGLARQLDFMFNKRLAERETGFVLLVFPFGDAASGRVNYISNGERSDIVIALKEIVARFEGQPHMGGTA